MPAVVLRQSFLVGRFHATPWKAAPFLDPNGEWPPSPWRLLRALMARWYQWRREDAAVPEESLSALVTAFCGSELSWALPTFTWRGPALRQYQPAEFKRDPASTTKKGKVDGKSVKLPMPGMMAYTTTKYQDNSWLLACSDDGDADTLWWVLDGPAWNPQTLDALDACLARLTYFGRAESLTSIRRVPVGLPAVLKINCRLSAVRAAGAVSVLAPRPEATPEQVGVSTDRPEVANQEAPPGARWMFAGRPTRPAARERSRRPTPAVIRTPVSLVQFALGGRVFPPEKSWALLTERFRSAVLQCLRDRIVGRRLTPATALTLEQRHAIRLMSGKEADGTPLRDHGHAFFLLLPDRRGRPSRLLCHRVEPFTTEEEDALLTAAEQPLAWEYDAPYWSLRLVPLPPETPLPADCNPFSTATRWRSLTLYVPPRHMFATNGKPKRGESVEEQAARDLVQTGHRVPLTAIEVRGSRWIKAHRPSLGGDGPTNRDKRGYDVVLAFAKPVTGPLALGHSSHFGLGLFVPEFAG